MVERLGRAVLVSLGVLLPAIAAPGAAQEVAVHADQARLHAFADTMSEWVVLNRGAVLRLLEQSGDWMRVEFDGARGFVHERHVIQVGIRPQAAEPESSTPATSDRRARPERLPTTLAERRGAAAPTTNAPPARRPSRSSAVIPLGPRELGYKDPVTGRVLSVLVPGGGSFYAGEMERGSAILGVSLLSLVLGAALSSDETSWPLYGGYAAAGGAWVYGIVSAGAAAERANYRNGGRRGNGSLSAGALFSIPLGPAR